MCIRDRPPLEPWTHDRLELRDRDEQDRMRHVSFLPDSSVTARRFHPVSRLWPMGAGHSHGHAAGRAGDRSRLRLVLAVTCAVIVVEAIGAWVSGSFALLADAGHMVTDAASVSY